MTTLTYPNGRVLNYNYNTGINDDISRLSSIADGANTLESYDYLGAGTVVRRGSSQTGVDLSYVKKTGESDSADSGDKYTGFDRFGRVVDQRWRNSSTDLDRYQYGYDRDSNRLNKDNLVSSSNSELYGYDNLNQLTSFSRGTLNGTKTAITGSPTRSQAWDFDALGNFDSQTTNGTSQSRSHNKQNEITSIASATTPAYDSNGNTLTNEGNYDFTYDAWNRLITVRDASNNLLATYSWDGLGRRVRETRGATVTDLYYSSAWQVLEERVGGTARISYAWSPVYVDAMIARDRDSDSNGSLEERLYVAQDANFNVTALFNTSGAVQERFQYDPFGVYSVLDSAWASRGSSNYAWNYLHQGGRWDADAGLYSFRHREYSPTLGRWMTNDPIGFKGENANFYSYINNRPILLLDSFGLTPEKCFKYNEGVRGIRNSCGPDVTDWFSKEIDIFANAAKAERDAYNDSHRIQPNIPGDGYYSYYLFLMKSFMKKFQRLARLADYKLRTIENVEPFDYSKCKDPDAGTETESVTLCGVCIQTNQLGNIIYGIIAVSARLEDDARAYGRGELNKFPINAEPIPNWLAPGQSYRQSAFELGVDFQRFKSKGYVTLCDLVKSRAANLTDINSKTKTPCTHVHKRPNTDMSRDPLTKPSGNR